MFAEDPSGQSHCAERAEQLERLGKGDADFLDGNVIKNVRHRDAGYDRGRDIPESAGEWKKQGGGNETNETKTTNGTEPGGWTFYQDTVKRPTNGGDEGNQQSANSNVPGGSPGLKTKHANCAE